MWEARVAAEKVTATALAISQLCVPGQATCPLCAMVFLASEVSLKKMSVTGHRTEVRTNIL